jgi:hypothetical protein
MTAETLPDDATCPQCGSDQLSVRTVRIHMLGQGLVETQVPHCNGCHTDLRAVNRR